MKKAIVSILAACLLFAAFDHYYHKEQRRFTPSKVLSFMPYNLKWVIPETKEEDRILAKEILTQKFRYFDKGSQAYVFLSEDGNYVLKLFKQHSLRPTNWLTQIEQIVFKSIYYKYKYKRKKFRESLISCKNAFVGFKEETGLIYLHLNRAPDLGLTVACIDEQGVEKLIEIDNTVFMLQKRAEMIYPSIEKEMNSGEPAKAKEIISSVIGLLRYFDAQGVYENDPVLRKNFGVIEGKAVQIDVGKFCVNPNKPFKENIERIASDFKEWIDSNYPELSEHIAMELKLASG